MESLETKKMEPSWFRVPDEAVKIAQKMLDPECQEPFYVLRPQLMNAMPADKPCFLGIDYEAKSRQIPAPDVLNEKDYITVFDPGDNLVAVISSNEVMHKEDFAAMMESCGLESSEENFNKVWTSFPNDIPRLSSLKDLALAAVQATLSTEPLEFIFDEEILVSEDLSSLEGYVWATDSLVRRLQAQEPALTEDQFMENINFYPVFDVDNGKIKIEGHYYLEDTYKATPKAFNLPLTTEESGKLKEAFETYCMEQNGKSCLGFIREVRGENTPQHESLDTKIQSAFNRISEAHTQEPSLSHMMDSQR